MQTILLYKFISTGNNWSFVDIGKFAKQNVKKVINNAVTENNYTDYTSVVASLTDKIQALNPL